MGRILTKTATDELRDIRNRAILMLLAIYGMRSGEVASLRLDQIDWRGRVLRLFRLKRRQAQVYPLLPSVAEALARYIDTVRPPVPHSEVFIRLQAPWRPIKPSSLYDIANREFVALGIQTAHPGPHALRHACATRLLADGLSARRRAPLVDGFPEGTLGRQPRSSLCAARARGKTGIPGPSHAAQHKSRRNITAIAISLGVRGAVLLPH